MKIIGRSDLNTEKWDQLVKSQVDSTVFSLSWYLDATAENWAVITDEAYSCGMALPFSIRLGQETLYTPIFVRYLEFFGTAEQFDAVMEEVNTRFKNIHLNLAFPPENESLKKGLYQRILPGEERKLSTHAKRMLKKAARQNWEVKLSENEKLVSEIVQQELKGKIEGINDRSVGALEKLLQAAKQEGCLKVYAFDHGGAIACLETPRHCLYLKGTTEKEKKEQGAMYLLMHTAIEQALSEGKIFDFGGSKAEGVRRFNCALGGSDVHYSTLIADNSPIWFKFAKRIRNTWRKFY